MAFYREYRFRSTFACSHEDYLDQPVSTTEWLIAIDNLVRELQNG